MESHLDFYFSFWAETPALTFVHPWRAVVLQRIFDSGLVSFIPQSARVLETRLPGEICPRLGRKGQIIVKLTRQTGVGKCFWCLSPPPTLPRLQPPFSPAAGSARPRRPAAQVQTRRWDSGRNRGTRHPVHRAALRLSGLPARCLIW